MTSGSALGITHDKQSARKQKGLDQGQGALVAEHELGLGTGPDKVSSGCEVQASSSD